MHRCMCIAVLYRNILSWTAINACVLAPKLAAYNPHYKTIKTACMTIGLTTTYSNFTNYDQGK